MPGNSIISRLLATTDPLGNGEMIDIITNAGFYAPAKQGNRLHQSFATLPQATASFDIFVVSGSVTGGLVLSTGPFASFTSYGYRRLAACHPNSECPSHRNGVREPGPVRERSIT